MARLKPSWFSLFVVLQYIADLWWKKMNCDGKHDSFESPLVRSRQAKNEHSNESSHRLIDVCRVWLGSVSKIEFIVAPININLFHSKIVLKRLRRICPAPTRYHQRSDRFTELTPWRNPRMTASDLIFRHMRQLVGILNTKENAKQPLAKKTGFDQRVKQRNKNLSRIFFIFFSSLFPFFRDSERHRMGPRADWHAFDCQ
jgi:hypothetical protein